MTRGLVIAACVAASAPAPAYAEPSKADQLFAEGKVLSDQNQWQGACDKFEQAIQLDAEAPGTMLNLGRCNEKLGKIGTALIWYQKAAEHAEKYKMPDYAQAAQERTADLSQRVPSLRFEFSEPLPAGGRLFVDGTEVAQRDQARLSVDPGLRKIDVQVPHKAPIHQEVTVKERDDIEVKIEPFRAAEFVDPGAARRHHAYLVGGIGAGLFVGQGIVGFAGYFKYRNKGGDETSWNNFAQFGLTSVAVVGAAGIAVGAYLYLTAQKPYEADHATALVPVAGPNELGVAYVGRF